MKRVGTIVILALGMAVTGCALEDTEIDQTTQESHSWGNYHWARSSNPFTLDLGDNVTSSWDSYLATASTDWSKSTVLDTRVVAGAASTKRCKPTAGRAEVCNASYGRNGWLGIAQIWASGDHITQGVVKMNDSYFNSAPYNTTAWKNLVMCQEVGHIFGLDHQDENFNNQPLGTCMDYSNDPNPNQHPDQHDYEQLQAIYGHSDGNAAQGGGGHGNNNADDWGELVESSEGGHKAVYVKHLGNGTRIVTHVLYAE